MKTRIELPHWKDTVVEQKHRKTGCIPTAYEWMISYLEIKSVNLDTFQDDFDLELRGEGSNSFITVAERVIKKYPQARINVRDFTDGLEKIEFIKGLLQNDIPCVMSLTIYPEGGWHMVPVVYIDDTEMKVVWTGDIVCRYTLTDIINRHNNWPGGKDIAWIEI